jgi:hypothetical protein
MTAKSKKPEQHESSDVVWGAEGIGEVINRSPRQVFYLLKEERLPAKKIGDSWVASRRRLLEHVSGE